MSHPQRQTRMNMIIRIGVYFEVHKKEERIQDCIQMVGGIFCDHKAFDCINHDV